MAITIVVYLYITFHISINLHINHNHEKKITSSHTSSKNSMDEEEIRRALKIPNLEILGINNRNLNTFEVDIRTTEKLINGIPGDILKNLTIVSESGFLSKEDVEYAEKLNVDGLLIGEALMKGLL